MLGILAIIRQKFTVVIEDAGGKEDRNIRTLILSFLKQSFRLNGHYVSKYGQKYARPSTELILEMIQT